MLKQPVKIVIADDHPIVLDAITATINSKKGWRIVGEASNGYDLLKLTRELEPDVAIVDLEMPKLKGYDTIAELTTSHPNVKSIALSGFLNAANRQRAIEAGASATVSKSLPMSSVLKAIQKVIEGGEYHTKESSFVDDHPIEDEQNTVLTLRETQVLKLIAQGKSSRNIGDLINISPWTVDKHRANIKAKLGLKNVAEMVRYAIDNNYIEK